METIAKLEVENFLDINEKIRRQSLTDKNVEYGGFDDYPIRMDKLRVLVKKAPSTDILDTATYYLKNHILLQPFADANHRTALAAVELFLNKNDMGFSYTTEESYAFQKELYRIRYRTYKTYEEMGSQVFDEEKNEVYEFCRKFIEDHLTKGD